MASATSHQWKFDKKSTALQVVADHNLEGKYAIVTGSNTGIGLETARALVSAHCHVVLACRDMKKAEEAVNKIKSEYPDGKVEAIRLDLVSFGEVKKFADAYLQKAYPLHYLILNAGVIIDNYQTSVDGYEITLQTNHLAQMYLTQLLESNLVASAPSRVVVLTSIIINSENQLTAETLNEAFFVDNNDSYNGVKSYAYSKCCNVLFARELSDRLSHKGVTSYSVHPGVILTNIILNSQAFINFLNSLSQELLDQYERSIEESASTPVFCAVEKGLESFSGEFLSDSQVAVMPAWLRDAALAKHLWTLSEALIAKKTGEQ